MGVYRTSQNGSVTEHDFGGAVIRCTTGGRLDLLCTSLHKEFPALRMEHKRTRWYWRLLHWLVLIVTFGGNRRFNDTYTTTIGMLIGWSDHHMARIRSWSVQPPTTVQSVEDRIWSTLQHEREHLRQFDKFGLFAMLILYVFVFFPIGLAWFRAYFERAGYLRTLRCWYVLDRTWAESAEARKWWIGQFTTGAYGWMWIFPKTVGKWFDEELKNLQAINIPVTLN